MPVRAFLAELKNELEALAWLPYFVYSRPTILYPDDAPRKAEVSFMFRSSSWRVAASELKLGLGLTRWIVLEADLPPLRLAGPFRA